MRARSAGLLDAGQAAMLARLLTTLSRLELSLASRRRRSAPRVREADVVAVAARMRELLGALGVGARDTLGASL